MVAGSGIVREPNESLVKFYNRRLATQGCDDVIWVWGKDGKPHLIDRDKRQSSMDLGGER